jgi:hypothetical protein
MSQAVRNFTGSLSWFCGRRPLAQSLEITPNRRKSAFGWVSRDGGRQEREREREREREKEKKNKNKKEERKGERKTIER